MPYKTRKPLDLENIVKYFFINLKCGVVLEKLDIRERDNTNLRVSGLIYIKQILTENCLKRDKTMF